MPHIPPDVAESVLTLQLLRSGLRRVHQGKVRDTFELLRDRTRLLVVATDRISIFDFVLNALVAGKGEVLTSLTVFWLTQVLKDFSSHLQAYGSGIDEYLPVNLRRHPELQRRAIIVEKQTIDPIEGIVRGYLTGSGWKDYQRTGEVCGIELPTGLHDGSRLPMPIFTPSTKANEGHDMNITEEEARDLVGDARFEEIRDLAISLYVRGTKFALTRGIIIADTKFEFGRTLADEVLTPDSSRFWDVMDYQLALAAEKSPTGYDKQPVRDAGKQAWLADGTVIDISKLDPKLAEHRELVSQWLVPHAVLADCTSRYRRIQHRLTTKAVVSR